MTTQTNSAVAGGKQVPLLRLDIENMRDVARSAHRLALASAKLLKAYKDPSSIEAAQAVTYASMSRLECLLDMLEELVSGETLQ